MRSALQKVGGSVLGLKGLQTCLHSTILQGDLIDKLVTRMWLLALNYPGYKHPLAQAWLCPGPVFPGLTLCSPCGRAVCRAWPFSGVTLGSAHSGVTPGKLKDHTGHQGWPQARVWLFQP